MPRQIVPVSDVAAILLTQDEGDLRYLPLSYVPPATDLSNYWTKAQADGRYEPIDTMYTKLESDARFQPVGSYSLTSHNHDAAYLKLSGGTLTGDLTIQANVQQNTTGVAEYNFRGPDAEWANIQFKRTDNIPRLLLGRSPTSSNLELHTYDDAGAYVGRAFAVERVNRNFTIDGLLTVPAVVVNGQVRYSTTTTMGMEGANFVFRDAQGRNRMVAWDAGNTSFSGDISAGTISGSGPVTGQHLYTGGNVQAGYGAGVWTMMQPTGIYNGGGNLSIQSGNSVVLSPNNSVAGGYIHPAQDNGTYLGHPGIRWIAGYFVSITTNDLNANSQVYCPGASIISGSTGGQYIQMNYHQLRKGGGGHIQVAGAGNFEPETDNSCLLGGSVNRWQSVWSNNGGIQTSHATAKKNFTLLDPVACTEAVLGTDWISFEYLPPPPPEREEGETPKQRLDALDLYMLEAAKTYVSRKQNGYVLGHPTHKTHDLFGQPDRESASPSSDLGILACALQAALQRIAALSPYKE